MGFALGCAACAARDGTGAPPAAGMVSVLWLEAGRAVDYGDGLDVAPTARLSPAEALAERRRVVASGRAWFLRGFDRTTLYFVQARFEKHLLSVYDAYHAERLVEVRRSADAERALGVERTLELYEVGVRGVRGGMTPERVREVLGGPKSEVQLGPVGAYFWHYESASVLFLSDRVADVGMK